MNGDIIKEIVKMVFICRAIENGWIVKKLDSNDNKFEFIKSSNSRIIYQTPRKNFNRSISEPLKILGNLFYKRFKIQNFFNAEFFQYLSGVIIFTVLNTIRVYVQYAWLN